MKILDCTLRDGGYVNNWNFSKKQARLIYKSVSDSGIDYCEVGFIGPKKKHCGIFQHLKNKDISNIFGEYPGTKIGAMMDFKNKTLEIPEMVDIVRVAVHRNSVIDAIELCESLKEKVPSVSIQLMGFSTMSKEEIESIVKRLRTSKIDYVYVADSYGSILPSQLSELLEPLLSLPIKVGFHPHNSLQLAWANTLEAISNGVDMIDGSLLGIGRGAGNLPLEVVTTCFRDKYNPIPLLQCIDKISFPQKWKWGYDPKYMITGSFNIHPYYAHQGRDLSSVYESTQRVDSQTIGYSQEVLDDIMEEEVDLKLTFSPIEKLGLDRSKLETIRYPNWFKKLIQLGELMGHYHIMEKYKPYKHMIYDYKNIHKGQRCFIIATGPSLNKTPVSHIKNEIMFGVNTLYRGFDKYGIHPKYYVLGDGDIFHSQHKELLQTNTIMFLVGAPGHYYINNKNYYDSKSNCDVIPIQRLGRMNIKSDFSKDLTKGSYISGSVTIHCLQIAYYLGFEEVYLVGADCDYSKGHHYDGKRTIKKEAPVMSTEEGQQRVFKGYEICKRVFEKDGRKIYNATVGGKLEVFERQPLEVIV